MVVLRKPQAAAAMTKKVLPRPSKRDKISGAFDRAMQLQPKLVKRLASKNHLVNRLELLSSTFTLS